MLLRWWTPYMCGVDMNGVAKAIPDVPDFCQSESTTTQKATCVRYHSNVPRMRCTWRHTPPLAQVTRGVLKVQAM